MWSDTRHLQPLGKNATFATDMKPLCNHIQLVSKYAFVAIAFINRIVMRFVFCHMIFLIKQAICFFVLKVPINYYLALLPSVQETDLCF